MNNPLYIFKFDSTSPPSHDYPVGRDWVTKTTSIESSSVQIKRADHQRTQHKALAAYAQAENRQSLGKSKKSDPQRFTRPCKSYSTRDDLLMLKMSF